MNAVAQWLRKAWQVIRTVSGDDAYERYCQHHQRVHADTALLDRRAFYAQDQQAKWSGIKRCC